MFNNNAQTSHHHRARAPQNGHPMGSRHVDDPSSPLAVSYGSSRTPVHGVHYADTSSVGVFVTGAMASGLERTMQDLREQQEVNRLLSDEVVLVRDQLDAEKSTNARLCDMNRRLEVEKVDNAREYAKEADAREAAFFKARTEWNDECENLRSDNQGLREKNKRFWSLIGTLERSVKEKEECVREKEEYAKSWKRVFDVWTLLVSSFLIAILMTIIRSFLWRF